MDNRHDESTPLDVDFGWELEQLRAETQARAAEVAAVKLRLRQTEQRPAGAGRWALWPVGVGGLVAAAAALWLALLPAPEPVPQQLDLVSSQWTSEQVHQDVQLQFEGRGQLDAVGKSHDIEWREGRLKVSVTPKQDIQLDVRTPEAVVSVVGTVFEVHRDLTGTTVSVERGQVAVRCGDAPAAPLVPSDGSAFCETTSPEGRAALARARRESGDLDGALAISAKGLSVAAPGSYAAAELHWNRSLAFTAQEDWPAALSSAEALLSTDQASFATDGRHAAALAGRMASGCAAAEGHLRWLAEAGSASPTELAHHADCQAARAPAGARRWLESALAGTTEPGLAAQLQQRLDQLER